LNDFPLIIYVPLTNKKLRTIKSSPKTSKEHTCDDDSEDTNGDEDEDTSGEEDEDNDDDEEPFLAATN
jgi:hypothetical protein